VKETAAHPESCRDIVCSSFLDYHIDVPCDRLPLGWRDAAIHEETSDEKRLLWLEQSIAPVIQRMAATVGRDTLLEVLGLADGDGLSDNAPMDDGWDYGLVP
jgi:hypothetical protein